jgi:rhomboid family protein
MIIPLKDKNPSRTVPFMTIAIIGANILVFLYELSLGAEIQNFIVTYGLIPARFVRFYEFHGGFLDNSLIPLFASMFLHAGWFHIIANMWFLWIFGDNVEDKLGHGTFLFFYLFCGMAAGLWQVAVAPYSRMPTIGASGAISSVLGAYLVSFPFARIYSIFIIFPVEVPAAFFLVLWFAIQFLAGTAQLAPVAGQGTAEVAYWEHIGGFISGLLFTWMVSRKFS